MTPIQIRFIYFFQRYIFRGRYMVMLFHPFHRKASSKFCVCFVVLLFSVCSVGVSAYLAYIILCYHRFVKSRSCEPPHFVSTAQNGAVQFDCDEMMQCFFPVFSKSYLLCRIFRSTVCSLNPVPGS